MMHKELAEDNKRCKMKTIIVKGLYKCYMRKYKGSVNLLPLKFFRIEKELAHLSMSQ